MEALSSRLKERPLSLSLSREVLPRRSQAAAAGGGRGRGGALGLAGDDAAGGRHRGALRRLRGRGALRRGTVRLFGPIFDSGSLTE